MADCKDSHTMQEAVYLAAEQLGGGKSIETILHVYVCYTRDAIPHLSCMLMRGWSGVDMASLKMSICLSVFTICSFRVINFSPVVAISSR